MITITYLVGVGLGWWPFSWWHGFAAFMMDWMLWGKCTIFQVDWCRCKK